MFVLASQMHVAFRHAGRGVSHEHGQRLQVAAAHDGPRTEGMPQAIELYFPGQAGSLPGPLDLVGQIVPIPRRAF